MRKLLSTVVVICFVVVAGVTGAQAAIFTPSFSDYSFSGSQFDVDVAANTYYSTNYGITMDHMYLYTDSRDTFDGIGIANGWLAENNVPNITGRVDFADTTDFVTIDWLVITGNTGTYRAYDSSNGPIATFSTTGGEGTQTISGSGLISYLTLTSTGGYAAISGMTYNYDGTTDGTNNDLNPVPEPGTMMLLGSGLVGLAGFGRRRFKK